MNTLSSRAACWGALFFTALGGVSCAEKPASAQAWRLEPLPGAWRADGFAEALDLSGIASVNGRECLVVSDELLAAQAGQIDRARGVITAGAMLTLMENPGGKKMELDLEGVAASPDGAFYYLTGSHGVGKKKGDVQPQRFFVFQVPVDPKTGAARREGIQRASLLPWLEKSAEFSRYVRQPLQSNGFNIEGIASAGGKLFFGVRGPNAGGTGYVIEADARALFAGEDPKCVAHALPLGAGRGVRDIVACRGGFLLVLGNASAEPSKKFPVSEARQPDSRFEIAWWQPDKASSFTKIGEIPATDGKAEGLLVLEEAAGHVDVLCLFDGSADGGPAGYRLHRPAAAVAAAPVR